MKRKAETTLSKVEVSFAGVTFNMEGPEVFVREGWEYLRNQLLPHLEKTLRGRPSAVPQRLKRPESDLAKFYKEKRPKSQPETITTLAYYLKHLEGKEGFVPSDLKSFYGGLGLPISRKIAQSVWDTFKKRGFLIKGDKRGLYKISPKGEEFVEKQLPTHLEEPLPKDIFLDLLVFGRKTAQIKIEIFDDDRPVVSIPGQPIFADGETIDEAKRNLLHKMKRDLAYLRQRKAILAPHLKAKLDFLENFLL